MTWQRIDGTQLTNTTDRINDIAVVGNHRWAVSAGGNLFRWTGTAAARKLALGGHARCVGFASDGKTGWVGLLVLGANVSRLQKTTDGGKSWKVVDPLPTDPVEGICGLCVLDKQTAYACGTFKNNTSPGLWRTTDGSSWSPVVLPSGLVGLTDLHFWDAQHGIVVGGGGKPQSPTILLTNDGGTSWHQANVPGGLPSDCIVWKVFFLDGKSGFVSISQRTQPSGGAPALILKTNDGGKNWTAVQVAGPGNWDVQGVGFLDDAHGWAGNHEGITWQTSDSGAKWSNDPALTNVNRLVLANGSFFATGDAVYVRSSSAANKKKAKPPRA